LFQLKDSRVDLQQTGLEDEGKARGEKGSTAKEFFATVGQDKLVIDVAPWGGVI
jgi:hypothetical protein